MALPADRQRSITLVDRSAMDASLTFSSFYMFLKRLVPKHSNCDGEGYLEVSYEWLLGELDELLADIQEVSANELSWRKCSDLQPPQSNVTTIKYGDREGIKSSLTITNFRCARRSEWNRKSAVSTPDIITPVGKAIFVVSRDFRNNTIVGARLTFIPSSLTSSLLKSFYAAFGAAVKDNPA